jgi:DNA-binding NarL/FixJ family response regulator
MTIRIVIADDQALVRAGLRTIFSTEADIQVVGEAEDGGSAIALVRELAPDLVLLDVRMPGMDGLTATRELLRDGAGGTRVVILTTFDLDEYVYQALLAGASGFLVKDLRDEDLIAAVRSVAAGDTLLAPSVTRRLVEAYTRRPPAPTLPAGGEDLTPRELEVWHLVARGRSNSEIACDLYVSEATAKTHVSRLMAKLGARDRVHLVVLAYESGRV